MARKTNELFFHFLNGTVTLRDEKHFEKRFSLLIVVWSKENQS